MVNQLQTPSRLTLYSGLIFLIIFAMVSLGYFVVVLANLVQELNSLPDTINFNKGVFYLPGVVMASFVLIYVIIYESVLKKHLTNKITSVCTRIALFSVAVIFVLPQLIGYGVDEYLTNKNYLICDEASHQWLHSQTIVYTNDLAICAAQ